MGSYRTDKKSERKSLKNDKKRSKKEHKHKHKKRKHYESSTDEEADFMLDVQTAPVAAEYVRCILRKFPAMKGELRDLVWRIDAGEGVRVDGLDNLDVLKGLRGLFAALNLKRSQETYSLKPGQDKILRRIGVVFNEQIPDCSSERLRLPGDPSQSPPPVQSKKQRKSTPLSSTRCWNAATSSEDIPQSTHASPVVTQPPDDGPETRKVMFPAAAPQKLLQAAAEAAAAMRAEGLLGEIVSGLSAACVGPSPPTEVLQQLEAVSRDVRVAEVVRIASLLSCAGEQGPDAYQVLDVPVAATSAEVRKKFWRTSLLVHPDKCRHTDAAAAFDAVKKAAEALMDSSARERIDARKHNQEEAELNRQVAAELELERRWRIAQGTAKAEDLNGPAGAQDVRDEWMTALPERRESKPAYMAQSSVTSFSQQSGGSAAAAVDAGWMALPGQSSSQVHMLTSGAVTLPTPTVRPMTPKDSISAKNAELLALAQQQAKAKEPEQERPQSLLEQHQQAQEKEHTTWKRQQKEANRRATEATSVAAAKPPHPEWAGTSAWRPFDREKDLQAPGRSSGPGPKLEQTLAARFRPASS